VKKILVVDDEPTLLATLKYSLEQENYEVLTASDGEAAVETARSAQPDLIVLDLMLPGMSGIEVCRVLRKETFVPVLMLTAKDSEVDKVVGLEIGADDYMTKPFGMPELLARVRALLRRAGTSPPIGDVLRSGDLKIDLTRREAYRADNVIHLKPKEFELLTYFVRNPGRAVTREQLLSDIWGFEFLGDTRTVDVHVRWLRTKIEESPEEPVRLVTVRGTGYRFEG
jgi:two-component system alkaline phosphatase synthesis response regulator PhoP